MHKRILQHLAGCSLMLLCALSARAASQVTVTAATGGTNISADSAGVSWTTLTGPAAAENAAGLIGNGTIVLSAPGGFLFNTNAAVTVKVTGSTTATSNINHTANNGTIAATVAPDGSSVTVTITSISSFSNTLTWQNLQARPTAGTPLANASIAESGTSVLTGLSAPSGWGTLKEVGGAATSLAFGQEPSDTISGQSITPAVTVQALDQFGNVSPSSSSVTLAIDSDPGGGTLSGATTVTATAGTATFTNLSIDKSGAGYTLTANSAGLAGDTSTAFNILVGTATKLAFVTFSQVLTAGVNSATITVQELDANGNVVVQSGGSRTITLSTPSSGGIFRDTGNLSTITSVTIPNGSSSASFLYRDTTVGTPALTAASTSPTTLTSATQVEFIAAGAAAMVRVETSAGGMGTVVPQQNVTAGNSLTVYSISRDAYSNFVANVAADSWSLKAVTGGVTNSDLVAAGDNKSATFTGHLVGTAAIHTSSGTLTTTDSGTLKVVAGAGSKLMFTTPAQTLSAGANSSAIGVQVQDSFGNAVKGLSGRTVALSTTSALGTFKDSTGTLTITNLTIGFGSSSTNFLYRDTLAGSPTITASSSSPTSLTSATQIETINPGPASRLQILLPGENAAPGTASGKTGAPAAQTATVPIANGIVVAAVDAWWNVVAGSTNNVTITSTDPNALIANDNGAAPGQVTLSGGKATLSSFTFYTAGTQTNTATDASGSLAAGSSAGVAVSAGGTATTVASSQNPTVAGQSITSTATVTSVSPASGTPAGTVTFKDGAASLGTGTLDLSGHATFSTTSLSVSSHSITAVYAGNSTYAGSTSQILTQLVNKAGSTTALTSSANPSVFGQPVILTAAVSAIAPGAGTPTGTVVFKDGATPLSTNTLNGGQAAYTNVTFAVGSHSLSVAYNADINFSSSASLTVTQAVQRANAIETIVSSANPSVLGQSVTFTITISAAAPGAGTPTGTVQFSIDGNPFGSAVSLSAGSASSGAISSLVVGGHSVTAAYSGDTNFNAGDNTASPFTQTVNPANTTTSLSTSTNPTVFGQSASFTATVGVVAPGVATPTGTVTFKDAGISLATRALNGSLQATFVTASLSVATHSITAVYNGDGNCAASTSATVTQTVNQASTTTAVSSSANPAVFGQSVTFTATPSANAPGSGTPTGTVTFKDGATTLGTGTLSSGQATFTTSALTIGSHSITAVYGGDSNCAGSTSAVLGQVVNKVSSTTALASSANPSVFNQPVTLTATVSAVAPGSGTPTGTVTFKDGSTSLATNTLSGGQASYTNNAFAIGSHSITAVYSGDSSFNTSTSGTLTQNVGQDNSTTLLTSSTNPTVFGQAAVFTASVSAVSPGTGTPTGTVTFNDGATALSTNNLSAGTVSYTNTALAPGSHWITAVYNGNSNFATSTSITVTQTVGQAGSKTTVASSANPSVFGQPVTFTATVTPTGAGAGAPTGTVQFSIDGSPLGSPVNLSGGSAAIGVNSPMSVGGHTITAVYSGDSNFIGSDNTSSPLTQTVNADNTIITLTSSTNPSACGQLVIITTTVSAAAPGSGTPTGTVVFKDGATALATNSLASGQATFSTSALSVGSHSLTAVYNGDGNFTAMSSAVLTQTVNKANSSSALASSVNPSVFGQSVTITATVSALAPGAGTPTGIVTFKDGATTLGTGNLNAGQATFSTSALSVAAHSITAVYGGDSSFNTSTSSVLSQTVNQASSATALNSSTNPTVYGQAVTFTASISASAPGSGTPTGSVTFKDGAIALSTSTLIGGMVSYTNTTLVAGSHAITAVYNGDSNFGTSTSGAVTQVVNEASSISMVTSSTNPAVFGQPVTFTATVSAMAPGGNTPTGMVIFKDGSTALATNTLSGGSVTYTTSALAVASHSITVVYAGDSNFVGSNSSGSPLTQIVSPANSSTALSSSTNPTVFGQTVSFTATVSAVAPASGTPTGTVTFKDGATVLAANTLNGSGQATLTTSLLSMGSHPISAVYNGDGNYNTSTSGTVTQMVNQSATVTALTSSTNPSMFGQSVTFTAAVTATGAGAGTPTGTVTFKDGATTIGTGSLSLGQATLSISSLSVGSHTITAVYNGDVNFTTSTSAAVTQTVNKSGSTCAVASSANPSVFGQSVSFTATVTATAPGSGTPTGTVTFKDGATPLATNTLSAGSATYTTSSSSVGTHSFTVVYNGDGNFNTSTSSPLNQNVTPDSSATSLSSSTNPSVYGQAVVFTASVSANSPGSGTPTGTVTFKDGATALSTNTLSGGTVSYTNTMLVAGSHLITAVYNADSNFNTSTSATVTQVVNQASSTSTVVSSANPSVFGQSVTFTATVSAVAPGGNTPTGTVTFKDGGSTLGTGTLSSGQAAFATSALVVAAHTITAVYNGDPNFLTSTSGTLAQTVNQASSTTALLSSTNPTVFGQSVTFTAVISAVAPGSGVATGTVTFKDGGATIGTGSLSSGQATFSTAGSSVAAHSITAIFGGDGNFTTSSSGTVTQTVNKANSSTVVASSVNPSVFGQSVTFTATVSASAPGAGTPTGIVTFKDGAATLGTANLSAGQAILSTSALSVAAHSITATYGGDNSFNTSTSSVLTQTVNQDGSSTTLSSSTNPTVYGQPVVFTATVSANATGSGTPTGTVTFKDGTTPLSTNTLSSGTVSYTNTILVAGSHSITAVYNADSNFSTSTSGTLTQVINQASTISVVNSSINPSVFGQSVSFTATVSAMAPGGNTPTGTVIFKDGSTALATNTLSGDSAVYTTSALMVASHIITVVYGGDSNFIGSDSSSGPPLAQTVSRDNATSTVISATNPSVFGQTVAFTATVSAAAPGSGTPTGTVTIKDGATALATNNLSSGQATFSTSSLSVGAHSITIVYNGDVNFNSSSSSALTQTVNQSGTATALSSATNPSVFGQAVSFTATVAPSGAGAGMPTGTVTFKDGAVVLVTNNLSSGQATFSTASLNVASHTITAVYNGDGNFTTNTSPAVTQTVNKSGSTSVVASSLNPSLFGQSVTFTATVSAAAPGVGTPTGTVTLKDGATSLATNTLSGGLATFSISSMSTGPHSITAVYNGDGNFIASTSSAVTQTVTQDSSATTLTSSTNPTVFGQPVTFTANVSAVSPGSGTPTGTVTFKDGVTPLATNTLSGGSASFATSSLALASHSITAVYNGDSNFSTSTSGTVTQIVNQAWTTTALASSVNPSVFGQATTFTATVNPVAPGAGTRTGTVQFSIDGSAFGSPVSLSGGSATSGAITSLSVVGHTVTAVYSGDTNFGGSAATPLAQTVNKASATTSVTSSGSPSLVGDPVTFNATVSAAAPGAGAPSGTVQFSVDGTNFGSSVTLSGGSATTAATTSLAIGTHTATALYNGDQNFNSSMSANFTQTVASNSVTPATGGAAISADTTGGAFTSLTGPAYQEAAVGNVGTGTIILNAPSQFVFDTGGTAPTVIVTGGGVSGKNINGAASGTALTMTSITSTALTFTVTAASSGSPNKLTWQNVRVRPVAGAPLASGELSKTGTSTMAGVTNGTSDFGFLLEVAGNANKLSIQTQPSPTATAGVLFAQQPVVQVQDKFGNARSSANGNADNSTVVSAALATGSSTLQGTLTAAAANGNATFTNLSYNVAETITLNFTSSGVSNVTSTSIVVGPATASQLVFATQPGPAIYGSALSPQPVLKSRDAFGNASTLGLGASKMVAVSLNAGSGSLQGTTSLDIGTGAGNGTISFSGLKITAAGAGKQLAAAASGLAGATSSSFTITQAAVTASVTISNKVYNGSTAATIAGRALTGVVGADDVNLGTSGIATFTNKSVGTAKPVTVTGLSLSGTTAGNYLLASTSVSASANITAAPLTVSGIIANSKVYDGTTNGTLSASGAALVGVISPDSVSLSTNGATAAFVDKTVGTNKTVTVKGLTLSGTDASNYTLSQPVTAGTIIAATLTVSGIAANNKVYDGTTNATFDASGAALVGVISPDSVALNTNGATACFADKTAGTNKTVKLKGLTLSGADASNYTLNQPVTAANITAAPLTVTGIIANNKVYDGTTNATFDASSATLVGVIGPDIASLNTNGATAAFTDKNVGTNKTVAVEGLTLSGADASNYALNPTTAAADIVPAPITIVSGLTANDKVYDNTTTATLSSNNVVLAGTAAGDSVALSTNGYSANFATPNAGTNIAVLVTGLSLTGFDAEDYWLVQPTNLTANITPENTTSTLTASPNPAQAGATVTLTSKCSGAGPSGSGCPTGTVTFRVDSTALGTVALNGSGQAAVSACFLNGQSHTAIAEYTGDGNFLGSTNSLILTVTNAPTLVIQRISLASDRSIHVQFDTAANAIYVMQRATNVAGPWLNLLTNTAPESGACSFIDAGPPPAQGFYRVQLR